MSKSKGNVIDPWEIFRTKGADPLRWYFFSAGSPWTNRRVYGEGIDESIRKFLLTLWNTLSFFVTYANLEGFDARGGGTGADARPRPVAPIAPGGDGGGGDRRPRGLRHPGRRPDAGVASSTTCPTGTCAGHGPGSGRRPTPAPSPPSTSALSTRGQAAGAVHPVRGRRDLPRPRPGERRTPSTWRTGRRPTPALVDAGLEAEMALARRLVALGRAARGEARIKVRQPLRRALLLVPGDRAASPPRSPPRCRRSSTSRPSRWSRAWPG